MKSIRWKVLAAFFVAVTILSGLISLVPQGTVDAQATVPGCSNINAKYDPNLRLCTIPREPDLMTGMPGPCLAPFRNHDTFTCVTDPVQVPNPNGGGGGTGANTTQCPPNFTPIDGGKCVGQKVNGQCPQGTPDPANGNQCIVDGTTAEKDDCPIAKSQELRWLYCPVFWGIGGLTSTIDAFINEYLTTGNKIFEGENENGYKAAWETFRNFGIALVIIAGLIMLVSEAFGLEFIDAYTVRKVLPRLLIAVVGISLSWELTKFLITFFDTLGRAAGSIIYTSFNVGDEGIEIWALFTANMFTAAGIGAAFLLLGGTGIISLFGTLVLAMLIGAMVLIIRQVLIVACVIMAPLAIAAYVLPNTNKLASFWWDLFIKMLMLYPVATGMIALCKVLGKIAMQNPGGTGEDTAIGQLLATVSGLIIFVAGYGLLAAVPRFVGGAFANVAGIVNDKSRGGFDRLKNFRGKKIEDNTAAMGRGERFKGGNFVSDRFNAASKGVATFANTRDKTGFLTSKTARDQAYTQRDSNLAAQYAKSDEFAGIQFDDDVLRAQALGRNENEARANMARVFPKMSQDEIDRSMMGAKAAGGFSSVRQQAAAKQLAAIGTGYDNLEQMAQTVAIASRGNEGAVAGMIGDMRSSSKKAGRYDLGGAGQKKLMDLAGESIASAKSNNGQVMAPSQRSVQEAYLDAAKSTDNASLVRGKPGSTTNMSRALTTELKEQKIKLDGATTEVERASARKAIGEVSAKIQNMQQATMYGPEKSTEAMVKGGTQGPQVKRIVEASSYQSQQQMPATDSAGKPLRNTDGSIIRVARPGAEAGAQSHGLYRNQRGNSSDPDDPNNL